LFVAAGIALTAARANATTTLRMCSSGLAAAERAPQSTDTHPRLGSRRASDVDVPGDARIEPRSFTAFFEPRSRFHFFEPPTRAHDLIASDSRRRFVTFF